MAREVTGKVIVFTMWEEELPPGARLAEGDEVEVQLSVGAAPHALRVRRVVDPEGDGRAIAYLGDQPWPEEP